MKVFLHLEVECFPQTCQLNCTGFVSYCEQISVILLPHYIFVARVLVCHYWFHVLGPPRSCIETLRATSILFGGQVGRFTHIPRCFFSLSVSLSAAVKVWAI